MKTLTKVEVNFPTTESKISEEIDFSEMASPRKIEAIFEVSKLDMPVNGGKLIAFVQRSIDGITWVETKFLEVTSDINGEPDNKLETIHINENEVIGNKLRFRYLMTANNPLIHQSADFKLSALVK